MRFDQFKRLVSGGEKATVDFKWACNAFNKSVTDSKVRDKEKS